MIPQLRPRYPFGRRLHHGLVGIGLIVGGVVLAWDDRHDFPWWPAKKF